MPRKAKAEVDRTPGPDWFLIEWMRSLQCTQAKLARETGWSIATVNDIYHGRTQYYRGIVNTIATALHLRPFELFLHPDEAMAIRQFRDDALRVADASRRFVAEGETYATGT